MQEADDQHLEASAPTRAAAERRAAERRAAEAARQEKRPPSTSEEMHRGQSDLEPSGGIRVNRIVLGVSSAVILAFSLWAILRPGGAQSTLEGAVGWISTNLGWFYVLTVTVVIGFVIWVALSKQGTVRLGPDHSRPQYSLFTWVAMLFAAGVGIDMLFFSVTGPVTQYYAPPTLEAESAEAARDAAVWTIFHYGVAGWSMYSLLGMAMGYFAYRWGMPLSIRAVLYPLFGKRVRGATGHVIDIVTLVGTVFGVATSMGIGVVLLNIGLEHLLGLPSGLAVQIALVAIAVVMTIAACTSGVDKGIRLISELNIWIAGAMLLYIIVTGRTAFLLSAIVENIGRFVTSLPGRTMETMAYEPGGSEWMAGWTLFFWAFWLAWGPFVGLFLARISRGRTLREFVIAAITAPVLCDLLIVSVFGNSAMAEVLDGNDAFGKLAMSSPEEGWYALLEMFPGAAFLIGLATLSGLLFYLTSANSGAMVMSNFSSSIRDPGEDGPKWLRIYWAVLTAVLTVAMLIAGGVTTMEYATLIFALPVTIIAYLVMFSFTQVLRMEAAERAGWARLRSAGQRRSGSGRSWRQRMASIRAYPGRDQVAAFADTVVGPALEEVAAEFRASGTEAEVSRTEEPLTGVDEFVLTVPMGEERDFLYRAASVQAPVPQIGSKASRGEQRYWRLEVFSQTGSAGYDLMGMSEQQVIGDVLDCYRAHLAFLQLSHENDGLSAIAPLGVGEGGETQESVAGEPAPPMVR
ncbi:choline BCCT transporter BetT [Brachybacterium halotolerans]